MRKSNRSGLIAGVGVVMGVLLMFAGVWCRLEDGPNLRSWDELRLGKRLFFTGAAIALVVPVVAYLVGLRERRGSHAKAPPTWDDLT